MFHSRPQIIPVLRTTRRRLNYKGHCAYAANRISHMHLCLSENVPAHLLADSLFSLAILICPLTEHAKQETKGLPRCSFRGALASTKDLFLSSDISARRTFSLLEDAHASGTIPWQRSWLGPDSSVLACCRSRASPLGERRLVA